MQDADVSPVNLLHEIVAACLDYQPTFSLFGRQLTYQDAFSGEISRIVSSTVWKTPLYSLLWLCSEVEGILVPGHRPMLQELSKRPGQI